MIFVPYRKIEIATDMEKSEVELNLLEHIQESKSKNWFFTMTDDYSISGKKVGDVFFIRERHSKKANTVKVQVSSSPATVQITIHPNAWGLYAPFILFLIMMAFSLVHIAFFVLGLVMAAVVYISAVIGVVFDSWWFEGLLKKKILIRPKVM